MLWLSSLLAGNPSPEVLDAIARGVRAWLQSGARGATLPRYLGLYTNPEAVRRQLRDEYLRLAAVALNVDGPWQRACALDRAARAFMGHKWRCWVDLLEPPPHASDVDRWLWHAAKAAGGNLPGRRRLAQIIASVR